MLKDVFANQTLLLILSASLILSAADTLSGVYASIASHTFSLTYLRAWLSDHLLKGVFPIVLLAAVSAVIGALPARFPNADAALTTALAASASIAWAIAVAGFLTYAASTIKSLQENVSQAGTKSKPAPNPDPPAP